MTSGTRARTRSAARRARRALLVLAVLAGVLAMHGFAAAGTPAPGRHGTTAAPGRPAAHEAAAPVHRAGDSCRHLSDPDSDGMPMQHADGTCAAAGTATGYAPSAPPPAPFSAVAPPVTLPAGPVTPSADGRAPPDLAELQLLRI
ncbi:DUF6153 family protein [Streptomyces andamanensis]|uniref:DUF6153 family protein n=1 Tax=Streptomyces andamanensis TaxID=1565035 RepID=A0ABV8TGH4_9ACTN